MGQIPRSIERISSFSYSNSGVWRSHTVTYLIAHCFSSETIHYRQLIGHHVWLSKAALLVTLNHHVYISLTLTWLHQQMHSPSAIDGFLDWRTVPIRNRGFLIVFIVHVIKSCDISLPVLMMVLSKYEITATESDKKSQRHLFWNSAQNGGKG